MIISIEDFSKQQNCYTLAYPDELTDMYEAEVTNIIKSAQHSYYVLSSMPCIELAMSRLSRLNNVLSCMVIYLGVC